MRHLIAIDGDGVPAGGRACLLDRSIGLGVDVLRGGGGNAATVATVDRYLFVLQGEMSVATTSGREAAGAEALVVVPANIALDATCDASALWLEFSTEAAVPKGGPRSGVAVSRADPQLFEGEGFAHQKLVGRSTGSDSLRVNTLRVEPGAGSPDFHIHEFDQFYVILEGEMQIDIGRQRIRAGPMTLVHLPAGLVHRNFNAGPQPERHISLLVPEPLEDQIFDYAVDIHDREATFFDATSAMSPVISAPVQDRS